MAGEMANSQMNLASSLGHARRLLLRVVVKEEAKAYQVVTAYSFANPIVLQAEAIIAVQSGLIQTDAVVAEAKELLKRNTISGSTVRTGTALWSGPVLQRSGGES